MGLHISPGQEHLAQKVAPLPHPGAPDGGAQVGGVDEQPHIPLQEGAAHRAGRLRHLRKIGPVQHKVGQLRVISTIEGLPGLHNRPAEGVGERPQAVPLKGLLHLGGAPPPALHQQPVGVCPHRGPLYQGLGVVVVVLHLKQLHQPFVGHRAAQLPVQGRPRRREQLVQPTVGQGRQLLIAALGQHLHRLVVAAGLHHPLHPLPGHQAVLHRPHAG